MQPIESASNQGNRGRSVTLAFLPECGQTGATSFPAQRAAQTQGLAAMAPQAETDEEALLEVAARELLAGRSELQVLALLQGRARFRTPEGLLDLLFSLGSSGTVAP
jgi:hypothetical protein